MANPFESILNSNFKAIYTNMIDSLLADDGLTVPCRFVYEGSKWTECNNCWTAGTIIKTIDGYTKIEDIQIGDLVFDGNEYNKVISTFSNNFHGDLYRIQCYGLSLPQYMTYNHKLPIIKNLKNYYKKWQWIKNQHCIEDYCIEEVEAQNIDIGDGIIVPNYLIYNNDLQYINTKFGLIECDDDLLYLFGWWIAEGSLHYSYHTRGGSFTLCQSKEGDVAQKIRNILFNKFGLRAKIVLDKKSDTLNVNWYSVYLVELFKLFGHYSYNKIIPSFLWQNLSHKQKTILLSAYHAGDGHIKKDSQQYSVTTISPILAQQVFEILSNDHMHPSLYYIASHRDKKNIYHKTAYTNVWHPNRNKSKVGVKNSSIGNLHLIKQIDKKHISCPVYNIEVNKSHKYVANGILSCNCTINPISGMSTNIYKSGGPAPFTTGRCPLCFGLAKIPDQQTETIYMCVLFNRKDWIGTIPVNTADGDMQTISKISTLDNIRRVNEIIVDTNIQKYEKFVFERAGSPELVGLGSSSYIFTFWKRKR